MTKYKSFIFDREDPYNINLYQNQNKEITEGGVMRGGKGRPTGTGKFEIKPVFIGHYSSVSGVLNKIFQMELEGKEVSQYIKVVEDMTKYIEKLKIDFPVADKKILEQIDGEGD